MKRVLVLLALGALGAFSVIGAQSKEMGIITFDYPPLMGSSTISKDGVLVELLNAALADSKVTGSWEYIPTKRCIAMVNNSETLAFMGMIDYFDEATRTNLEELSLMKIRFMAFYRNDQFPGGLKFSQPSDLKDYTIGVLAGGITNKVAVANKLKVDAANDLNAVFDKLMAKRFDIGTAIDLAIQIEIARRFAGKESLISIYRDVPFVAANASLVLVKKHPDYAYFAPKIKDGLAAIAKNGTWLKILEKYYGKGNVPADSLSMMQGYVK